jgi:hypothetical protein
MRSPLVAALLVLTTTAAFAQPGQTPPPQPYPAPQPYPPAPQPYPPAPQPVQPYVPPPYAYQPTVQLTAEEARLLAKGEISSGTHFGGFAVGFLFGFGSGQAVQGRWSERGWIFTVGELASIVAMVVTIDDAFDNNCNDFESNCNDELSGGFVVSLIALMGFRVWELVDAAVGPSTHNRKVRELRARVGYPQPYYGMTPYLAPTARGDGGTAGITFRF